jgi:DNA polymerase-3 subunit epsilon
MNLLVFDTETGGFDPHAFSLLSIGAVWIVDDHLVEEFDTLVCEPNIVAEDDALVVNGLSIEECREHGKPPNAVVSTFMDFVGIHSRPSDPVILAGHNTWFDVAFLKRLFRLAGKPYPAQFSHRIIDTTSILQFLRFSEATGLIDGGSYDAFEYYGIKFAEGERHTALGDAKATAKLLLKLKECHALR